MLTRRQLLTGVAAAAVAPLLPAAGLAPEVLDPYEISVQFLHPGPFSVCRSAVARGLLKIYSNGRLLEEFEVSCFEALDGSVTLRVPV